MALYNFKKITVVPSGPELKDAVLSKTQRKTPTVVHKHYSISRIRAFYNRKVKYSQQTLHDKFTGIINEFPKLDDVHPFYADLMNILYDRDHYKIALGQISTARALVDKVAREYVRLMKYGDSLYRCKQLKRAALGRMMKIIRHQRNNLAYLEQIRQHLARLPSIDPNTRTLLLCGLPNVGKSSLLNTLTRANVDVQPYAFTTKSLYVGHMDYKYLRWQLIDTPGILDHPLEERNTIEMQAVTALAHLRAAVLFIVDLSEQCNETIESQLSLFANIRPLFTNKPVFIGLNKCDVCTRAQLSEHPRKLLDDLEKDGVGMFEISAQEKMGVVEFRDAACDSLLAMRVQSRLNAAAGKQNDGVLNRIYVAMPKPRDDKIRAAVETPQAILERRQNKMESGTETPGPSMEIDGRKLERQIEIEMAEDYILDVKKNYDVNPAEKYDKIPEIWNGHNVADFVDTNIFEKLETLRSEERAREAAGLYDDTDTSDDENLMSRHDKLLIKRQARKIRFKQDLARLATKQRKKVNKPVLPRQSRKRERSVSRLRSEMGELGVDLSAKRMRHFDRATLLERPGNATVKVGKASVLAQYASAPEPRDQSGFPDKKTQQKARKISKKASRPLQKDARKGEGDRHVYDLMPKHLFSGKRKQGKTSRR